MYFSHLMLCDRREGLSSQARYEQQLEEVRLLEALGYWCCWFAEHHFAGYALMPDCLLMAAAAARETTPFGPDFLKRSDEAMLRQLQLALDLRGGAFFSSGFEKVKDRCFPRPRGTHDQYYFTWMYL
jgi:luciferase-like monooxygenase